MLLIIILILINISFFNSKLVNYLELKYKKKLFNDFYWFYSFIDFFTLSIRIK